MENSCKPNNRRSNEQLYVRRNHGRNVGQAVWPTGELPKLVCQFHLAAVLYKVPASSQHLDWLFSHSNEITGRSDIVALHCKVSLVPTRRVVLTQCSPSPPNQANFRRTTTLSQALEFRVWYEDPANSTCHNNRSLVYSTHVHTSVHTRLGRISSRSVLP